MVISLGHVVHTDLSVEVDHAELFDLLLQWCQVSSAAAHAQFVFDFLSGVHGNLHSFVSISHSLLFWHEGSMKLLDLIQHLYDRIRGQFKQKPKTKYRRSDSITVGSERKHQLTDSRLSVGSVQENLSFFFSFWCIKIKWCFCVSKRIHHWSLQLIKWFLTDF